MNEESGQQDSLERRVTRLEKKLVLPPISADDVRAFRKVADALAVLVERLGEEYDDHQAIIH
jgi:limonene-1,2-epoxide hydrolase